MGENCATIAGKTYGFEAFCLKYLKQFVIIVGFSLLGELLNTVIPLPIPASIYGFILLFLALCAGIFKPEHVDKASEFLIGIMPVLFVAPAANILAYFDIIAPKLVPILVIVISSTFVVFAIAGHVTQLLRRKGERKDG